MRPATTKAAAQERRKTRKRAVAETAEKSQAESKAGSTPPAKHEDDSPRMEV